MNFKQIEKFLNNRYPIKTAEDWDTVGVVFGDKKQEINKIMISLDLTPEVVDKAIENKADAIIVHHPFIFKETLKEELKSAPYKKELKEKISKAGLCVFTIHTNFDKKDMNIALANKLGFNKPQPITGSEYGFIVDFDATVTKVLKLLKKKLNLKNITTNNPKGKSKKVAFLPGAGSAEDVVNAYKDGSKIVVTSDIKWSDKITYKELGVSVIEVSHKIEDVFVDHLANILEKEYEGIGILKSYSNELFKL